MTKIAFICNWGVGSFELLERYKLQTPNNSGKWGIIEGISNLKGADWIIALEDVPENFYELHPEIDPMRIIFFAREPEWYMQKNWLRHPSIYKFDFSTRYPFSTWMVERSYDQLKSYSYNYRNKNIVCITSNKRWMPGHNLRLDFIRRFCIKYDSLMDIFGVGMEQEGLGNNYKGLISYGKTIKGSINSKYDAMSQYKYALCIENGQNYYYFTEKICDSFLSLSMPIYWGCLDINSYFPEDSFYNLDINNPDAVDQLKDYIQQPLTRKNINALLEAKDLVLNKYNLWPSIEELIQKIH